MNVIMSKTESKIGTKTGMGKGNKEKEAILKEMSESGLQYGHLSFRRHPKMKKFILAKQNGVDVIDLNQTFAKMQIAFDFLSQYKKENKNILFLGLKLQHQEVIEKLASDTGMFFVTQKWFPGFITNFHTMKNRIRRLREIEEDMESKSIEKYTKYEQSKIMRERKKLLKGFGGVKAIKSLPDLLFVFDLHASKIAVDEARRKKIPVISIVDTNSDPYSVDFPIPANDDSVKSIDFFVKKIKEIYS